MGGGWESFYMFKAIYVLSSVSLVYYDYYDRKTGSYTLGKSSLCQWVATIFSQFAICLPNPLW